MQSHLECRLWNEVFVDAQAELGIPNGERVAHACDCGARLQHLLAPGLVLKPKASAIPSAPCCFAARTGTIKATCLIETLPAAFEMDEFLYELRDHSAGLNCGRWDYMFSFIKTMRSDPRWVQWGRVGVGGHV